MKRSLWNRLRLTYILYKGHPHVIEKVKLKGLKRLFSSWIDSKVLGN